jgi:hypothetical protein
MVPTALRAGSLLPDSRGRWEKESPAQLTDGAQVAREFNALRWFYIRADLEGIVIPGDSPELRRVFNSDLGADQLAKDKSGGFEWPPQSLVGLMAFAQHHGIATRLLDWSRNAYVAAYFAATEAAGWQFDANSARSVQPPPTHLAIWAFKKHHAWHKLDLVLNPGKLDESEIVELTAPGATNKNLHAQEGVFLLHRPKKVIPSAPVQVRTFEELLLELVEREFRSETRMLQFRLPISEAPTLLYELYRLGIDGASLFPGPQGVADALKESVLWKR